MKTFPAKKNLFIGKHGPTRTITKFSWLAERTITVFPEELRDAFSPSAEDVLLDAVMAEEARERKKQLLEETRHRLTAKQYRRLCLYYLEGKTETEISAMEGVTQQIVSKSILAAKKVLEKFFKEFFDNRG